LPWPELQPDVHTTLISGAFFITSQANRMKKIMAAGDAGFIGQEVVRQFAAKKDVTVIHFDGLTCAPWNDPDPAIERPATDLPRLSGKDKATISLSQAEVLS
jgi:hypothetical protein